MATQTILVESNSVHREAMRRMLTEGGYDVVASVASVELLHERAPISRNAIVVICGNDRQNGIESIAWVKEHLETPVIVMLGGKSDLGTTFAALQAGAHAYLDDMTSGEAFLKALGVASHDRAVISLGKDRDSVTACEPPPAQLGLLAPMRPAAPDRSPPVAETHAAPASQLSPREAAILNLLREGAPNKLIAIRLCMTESTVKVHLKAILRKIRVKNRTQAAVWAMENEKRAAVAAPTASAAPPSGTTSRSSFMSDRSGMEH